MREACTVAKTTQTLSSKLSLDGDRVTLKASKVTQVLADIFLRLGCDAETAAAVAAHLVETELSGVESHGIMRCLQYANQFRTGYMQAEARPELRTTAKGVVEVDGNGGIGIPAMRLAVDTCCDMASASGLAAVPVRRVGHTGRLGAYAERGADRGFFVMIVGGGGRQNWRQVAPYGGKKAVLPTNPFCFAMPGGERGPVVVDFATSIIAGGWLYAARTAGARVPEGAIIDADGVPSRDPEAYFNGGAILPKGGPMGYGLAVMAELICEAMLGPVTTEVNWLVLALDTNRYRQAGTLQTVAEEILRELRECPPADGFERVEIPGERERERRQANTEGLIQSPENTWSEIQALARSLGIGD